MICTKYQIIALWTNIALAESLLLFSSLQHLYLIPYIPPSQIAHYSRWNRFFSSAYICHSGCTRAVYCIQYRYDKDQLTFWVVRCRSYQHYTWQVIVSTPTVTTFCHSKYVCFIIACKLNFNKPLLLLTDVLLIHSRIRVPVLNPWFVPDFR